MKEKPGRNKDRKASNTTVSVSMSKEMKVLAKQIADNRGVENISALIRMLLKDELKRTPKKETADPADEEVAGVRLSPAAPFTRGAGTSSLNSKRF